MSRAWRGYDPDQPGAVHKGAEVAAGLMGVDLETHKSDKPTPRSQGVAKPARRVETTKPAPPSVAKTDPEPVDDGLENKPLTFELKLDPSHAWLKNQDFQGAAEFAGVQIEAVYPFIPSKFSLYTHEKTHDTGNALTNHDKFATWIFKPI